MWELSTWMVPFVLVGKVQEDHRHREDHLGGGASGLSHSHSHETYRNGPSQRQYSNDSFRIPSFGGGDPLRPSMGEASEQFSLSPHVGRAERERLGNLQTDSRVLALAGEVHTSIPGQYQKKQKHRSAKKKKGGGAEADPALSERGSGSVRPSGSGSIFGGSHTDVCHSTAFEREVGVRVPRVRPRARRRFDSAPTTHPNSPRLTSNPQT